MHHGYDVVAGLRQAARNEPESGIVEIFNYGRLRPGLIPLWVGEGDIPTPAFICDAATASLAAGETFYTYQRGLPELRAALAAYHGRLYGKAFDAENFFVTGSGMQAIQIAIQAVAGAGDEVVLPSPAWPNYPAALRINGARPVEVPMTFADGRWTLDPERLFAACSPRTRAIFINSPSNPLGTVLSEADILAVRDFARSRGIWLVADEVYARYFFPGTDSNRAVAPSFLDVCDTEERIICVNTFSKNWAMTGWRVGWLMAPRAIGQVIENLIQYNTSGVPAFHQRACVAALEQGEPFVEEQIARARHGRAIVCRALAVAPRVRFHEPEGAFYLFFAVDGEPDTRALCRRLIDETGVGVAPGTAFGPGGAEFMRLCFARSPASLEAAMDRLLAWL